MKPDNAILKAAMALAFPCFYLLATCAIAAAPLDMAPGRVTGMVSDTEGRPLSGAFVNLRSPSRGLQVTVISGRDGAIAISLPAGSYSAVGQLRGYDDSSPQNVSVTTGQKTAIKLALKQDQDPLHLESQIGGAELLSLLPDDARQAMMHRCAACHSLAVLGGKRMSQAGWGAIVERMSHKEPAGRGEGDALAPWEANPWSNSTAVLVKYFSPENPAYHYDPFSLHNSAEEISKMIFKEYQLKRPETNVHDIAVDASGKRVWYDDQASGEVEKTGLFGYLDPVTEESREYRVPQCHGLGGRILADSSGGVWAGCADALAHWTPQTDALTIYPIDKYGMRELWTVDSKGYPFTPLHPRDVDPNGDRRFSYIGKLDLKTMRWDLFKIPTPWGNAYETVTDSKDNIWFTEIATDTMGKLDPRTGQISEYPVPTKGSHPRRLAVDPHDNVWFTEYAGNKLGVVDSKTGKLTEYELPAPNSAPYACGVDKNGIVWFSEIAAMRVGRFDPKTKTFREYPIPDRLSSIKNLNFTYTDRKEVIWASDRTAAKIIEIDIPE